MHWVRRLWRPMTATTPDLLPAPVLYDLRTGDVLISGCAIARDAFLLRSEAKPSEKT